MNFCQRLAFVRHAAGLSQEQLAAQLNVDPALLAEWESGQAVPDALTAAKICEALHISADFLLLGKTPEEAGAAAHPDASAGAAFPKECPCCGRPLSGGKCTVCGFTPTPSASTGDTARYAIVTAATAFAQLSDKTDDLIAQLEKYCGMDPEIAKEALLRLRDDANYRLLLRRGLSRSAAQWLYTRLESFYLPLRIVEDCGEPEEELGKKETAFSVQQPKTSSAPSEGMTFGGTVLAVILGVILALILLSFL